VSLGGTNEAGGRRLRRRALHLAVGSGSELREHARRVARLALVVAEGMELSDDLRLEVELAALLHDIGKAALPMGVLAKPAPLDDEEWALMRIHTIEGERMARAAGFAERLPTIVRATHERWDGDGYPDGLAGRAIPWPARIVFCADAYDAMTNARPYRGAMPARHAAAELLRGAGTQFDPVIARRLAATVMRLEGRFRRTARDRDPRAVFARSDIR
jgi:two-component system cell cycle response regulator